MAAKVKTASKPKAAKSSKSSFDFQKYLLEKGERIALTVAGIGLALLTLFGLMAASKREDPNKISDNLIAKAQSVNNLLETDTSLPPEPKKPGDGLMVRVNTFDFTTPNSWFSPSNNSSEKRVNPTLLSLIGGKAWFVMGGVPVYDIQGDNIAIIENRDGPPQNNTRMIKVLQNTKSKSGRSKAGPATQPPPTAPAGVPGGGPPPGMSSGGRGGVAGAPQPATNEGEIVYLPLSHPKVENAFLARDLRPFRAAVVRGIVPYHEQVQKHMAALQFPTDAALAADHSEPTYKGFVVERRVMMGPTPAGNEKWEVFNHAGNPEVKELYRVCAEYEPEEPIMEDFRPEAIHRLYIRRPKCVRTAYPNLELTEFAAEKKKMDDLGLEKKDLTDRQKKLEGTEDIFALPDAGAQAGPPGSPPLPGGVPGYPKGGGVLPPNRNFGKAPGGPGQPQMARNTVTGLWLLQFVDPTIEPGRYYQYRIKLLAVNPNYGRKNEVAQPGMAEADTLSSNWFEIKDVVYFPPDEFLYASGDAKRDADTITSRKYDTIEFQFHRWFDRVRVDPSQSRDSPVAEWVVADIEGKRGQPIRQTKSFKLPFWSMAKGAYTLRDRISFTGARRTFAAAARGDNIDVPFSPTDGTILVDFDGGRGSYTLPDFSKTKDECAVEVLVVTDDANRTLKVASRNAFVDMMNELRVAREKAFKEWLDDVAKGAEPARNNPAAPPPRGS